MKWWITVDEVIENLDVNQDIGKNKCRQPKPARTARLDKDTRTKMKRRERNPVISSYRAIVRLFNP